MKLKLAAVLAVVVAVSGCTAFEPGTPQEEIENYLDNGDNKVFASINITNGTGLEWSYHDNPEVDDTWCAKACYTNYYEVEVISSKLVKVESDGFGYEYNTVAEDLNQSLEMEGREHGSYELQVLMKETSSSVLQEERDKWRKEFSFDYNGTITHPIEISEGVERWD